MLVTKSFFLYGIWTLAGLDMGLCLKLCPQRHNSEALSTQFNKTLRDIAAWSLMKVEAFGVI